MWREPEIYFIIGVIAAAAWMISTTMILSKIAECVCP